MYSMNARVCASRTGADGRMKLADALAVIQDCSMLWLESEPSFADFLRRNTLGMFLTSRQADIVRLPDYGERITVKTGIYDCNKFFGFRNTVLYGADGAPCVLTWCLGTFVSLETGKMMRLPKEEMERVTMSDRVDMEYLDKKILVPDLPGERLEPFAVRRSDIDLNRHMNNAKYIEAALEFLPDGCVPRRMRVEYKMPAKLSDRLFPQRIVTASGQTYILLLDGHGSPFAVFEFS